MPIHLQFPPQPLSGNESGQDLEGQTVRVKPTVVTSRRLLLSYLNIEIWVSRSYEQDTHFASSYKMDISKARRAWTINTYSSNRLYHQAHV